MNSPSQMEVLFTPPVEKKVSHLYATVTDLDPLTIALDGDDDDEGNLTPLDMVPVTLVQVELDDRVMCTRQGHQLVITGVVGGPAYASLAGGASANFTAMPQVGGNSVTARGSGANGYWIRYADGTQICYHQFAITPVADTPTSRAWTFPQSFVAGPHFVSVTAETTVPYSSVRAVSYANTSTTGLDAYVYRVNTTSTTVSMMAIGTWI